MMHAEDATLPATVPAGAPFDIPTLLAALPVGVVATNRDGCVVWANSTAEELFGAVPDGLIGHSFGGLPVKRRLRLSKTTEKIRVTSRSGHTRWIECIMHAVNAGGIATVCCLSDVTGYEERQQLLMSGATQRTPDRVDKTTGLLTREAVMRELAGQVSRSRRYRNPLSAIMIRIAPPKPIGDRVTAFDKQRLGRVVARLLRERLRWVDVAGMWGHDEFLLVLPETTLDSARQVVRKLRAQMKSLDGSNPGLLQARSITIESVEWRGGEDAAGMLERLGRLAQAPRERAED